MMEKFFEKINSFAFSDELLSILGENPENLIESKDKKVVQNLLYEIPKAMGIHDARSPAFDRSRFGAPVHWACVSFFQKAYRIGGFDSWQHFHPRILPYHWGHIIKTENFRGRDNPPAIPKKKLGQFRCEFYLESD